MSPSIPFQERPHRRPMASRSPCQVGAAFSVTALENPVPVNKQSRFEAAAYAISKNSLTRGSYGLIQKCYLCPQNNLLPMSPFGQ